MAKIKLTFPGNVVFSQSIDITCKEINAAGHLANEAIFAYTDQARDAFLKSKKINGYKHNDIGLIIVNNTAVYLNQAYENDCINIEIAIGEKTLKSVELFFRLISQKRNREVALVQTTFLCYDYNNKHVIKIPAWLDDVL